MKINFDLPLLDLEGKSLKEEDIKLKVICINALLADNPNSKTPTTGEQKFKNYDCHTNNRSH